jgi:hypothetical protein
MGGPDAKRWTGSHVTYTRGPDLVVEWYDFGEHAPYESANLLVFGISAQAELAKAIGAEEHCTAEDLAIKVATHFPSYFEVQRFADERSIAFEKETDFWP